MAGIEGFDRDAANVGHIRRHAVTPFEVEEHPTAFAVVFTIRRRRFRTVTAYEMNAAERRKYAPQID